MTTTDTAAPRVELGAAENDAAQDIRLLDHLERVASGRRVLRGGTGRIVEVPASDLEWVCALARRVAQPPSTSHEAGLAEGGATVSDKAVIAAAEAFVIPRDLFRVQDALLTHMRAALEAAHMTISSTAIAEAEARGERRGMQVAAGCGGLADLITALSQVAYELPGWLVTCGLCELTGHATIAPDYNSKQHGERLLHEFPIKQFSSPYADFSEDLAPGDDWSSTADAIRSCLAQVRATRAALAPQDTGGAK